MVTWSTGPYGPHPVRTHRKGGMETPRGGIRSGEVWSRKERHVTLSRGVGRGHRLPGVPTPTYPSLVSGVGQVGLRRGEGNDTGGVVVVRPQR